MGGVIAGTVAFHRWLKDKTPEDVSAIESYKEQRKRERLLVAHRAVQREKVSNIIATLHIRSAEPLCSTAEKLGYRIVRPMPNESQILLARPSGEPLSIGHNEHGQVIVTASTESSVRKLVRCHAADMAIQHLRGKGMSVQAVTLPNGGIQITSQEQMQSHDGTAQVTTQVHQDGSLLVDVDNLNSNRCESIVTELADAVGGNISDMKFKSG